MQAQTAQLHVIKNAYIKTLWRPAANIVFNRNRKTQQGNEVEQPLLFGVSQREETKCSYVIESWTKEEQGLGTDSQMPGRVSEEIEWDVVWATTSKTICGGGRGEGVVWRRSLVHCLSIVLKFDYSHFRCDGMSIALFTGFLLTWEKERAWEQCSHEYKIHVKVHTTSLVNFIHMNRDYSGTFIVISTTPHCYMDTHTFRVSTSVVLGWLISSTYFSTVTLYFPLG